MVKQSLEQSLQQKLSPQQIQLMKLIELSTLELEQKVKDEIETNPALDDETLGDDVFNDDDSFDDDVERGVESSESERDFDIDQYISDFEYNTNKANLNSVIFITDCEFLVAKDGSILVSANQIESHKIKDLPNNIIVLAKTSQLSQTVSKGLEGIRYKYSNNLPSNITSIKNFKRGKDEDLNFLTYGSSAKNLYLILLENL